MKWLILCNAGNSGFFTSVCDLLAQYDTSIVNGAEIFFVRDFSKKDIFSAFTDVRAVVMLDSFKLQDESDSGFLAGCIVASRVPVFIAQTRTQEAVARYVEKAITPGLLRMFKTSDSLLGRLPGIVEKLRHEEQRNVAFNTLFVHGMPFTPDVFATFIAKNKMPECKLYFEAGMDLNAQTSEGVPMLNIAVRNECTAMVKWLDANGADLNQIAEDRGYTPIMDAVWKNNVELVEYFISRGVRLDAISRDGQSILVLAVGIGNAKICGLLARHGADFNIQDKMGMSALGYAKLFHKTEIVGLFESVQK